MAGHLVPLTTFLVQAQPPALAVLEEVADLHRYRRADTGEAEDHHPDQRPVAEVGSPRELLPEAPTDPDVRNSRIRLFGSRLRYVTGEVRRRGFGSG
jgi:hypothetical protein